MSDKTMFAGLLFTLILFLCSIDFLACKGRQSSAKVLKNSKPDTVINQRLQAKIALGEKLFFERMLSANGTKSCASCHDPNYAFTDGYRRSLGIYADKVRHNSPTLINTRFYATLTWANPDIKTYQEQVKLPMFGQHPPEMGLSPDNEAPLQYLAAQADYQKLFEQAFGIPHRGKKNVSQTLFTYEHVFDALAAFENTLVSFQTPYDRYVAGDTAVLSPAAKRGQTLFFSSRLQCATCHPPPLFTDADTPNRYHNIGLYCLDSLGSYPQADEGLYEYTRQTADKGRFRTPTLRNVALTAPYMHDGSIESLAAVVALFEKGGYVWPNGPNKGDGSLNPNKSSYIKGFILTPQERSDLLAFLLSLSDENHNR